MNRPPTSSADRRTVELFEDYQCRVHCWTDRLFAWLLVAQWLIAIVVAIWVSPLTWAGTTSATHPHVWVAILLGLATISLPCALVAIWPGRTVTRLTVAVAQALMSALLIHLTGGRLETHFHVFASLALLAFYRDWRVLFVTSAVVAADHFVRGIVWPQSVYGTTTASPWRFVEHAGWVVVEDIFLLLSCRQSLREMWNSAERQSQLESANRVELLINDRLRNEMVEREQTQKQLEQAKAAAEAANVAKSEFLANMSHELRTPLNAIIGFSDILGEQVFGPLSQSQQQYVADILDSGQHLLSLVNDILDLAKIEAGMVDFQLVPIDLVGLVERTVHMFRERAIRLGISITAEIEREFPPIYADERKLKQLLYNLLSNAIKFTAEEGRVTVRVRCIDEAVVLSVADTGVGIAEEEQTRIFETFYQVDSTLVKAKQGTGLGLALVRQIANLHGGQIRLTSKLGVGSEFFFELPLRCPDDAAASNDEQNHRGLIGTSR